MLSFKSAGQILGSRVLNLAETQAVALTSMLHDVATHPKLLASPWTNTKRNRRVLASLGILIGVGVGGSVSQATGENTYPAVDRWGSETVVTIAWMVWPEWRPGAVCSP